MMPLGRLSGWLGVSILAGCGDVKLFDTALEFADSGQIEDSDGIDYGYDTDDDEVDTASDTASADTAEEEEESDPLSGVIRGTITVELYSDASGVREYVSWEEAGITSFPYGRIFVGAYASDENGVETYYGSASVTSPSLEGDEYEMTVSVDEVREVLAYAALDYSADTIIHTTDPIGVYPDEILIEEGSEADDVDITILVEYTESSGGGGGGGSECDYVSINGPVFMNDYGAGEGMAMVADSSGNGPYYWDSFTPDDAGDGSATSVYEMSACEDYGEMNLLGAVDSNENGLIDPADDWGAYVSEEDVDGNPINIETSDLNDYAVQIPLGEDNGLSIVPFVKLSGTLGVEAGDLSDLTAGTTVFVAALKYRPNSDTTVSALKAWSYDYE